MKEQEVIIKLSKMNMTKEDKNFVIKEVEKGVNWKEIVYLASRNKTLPLLWKNIKELHSESFVPVHIRKMIQYVVIGVRTDNILFLNEFEQIKSLLLQEEVLFLPLKGIYMIPNIYKSCDIRTMGDIDCLVDRKDVTKVQKVMAELGYVQGEIDLAKKEIKPFERFKEIVWNTQMTNMPPFYKLSDESSLGYVKVDFSVCLDFDRNYDLTQKLLKDANINSELRTVVLFLHVCAHLYKEATNDTYIKLNKDVNLVKFCDVREFLLSHEKENFLDCVVKYANANGLGDALYYSLYYLIQIYGDDYSNTLKRINMSDVDIISYYKKSGSNELIEWKKNIMQRLFSDSNEDEMDYDPEFFKIFEMKHAVTKK